MRIPPLILPIILVLLLMALYYCRYTEGFETLQEKIGDRFNPLAGVQNPLTNPAVPIGITESDGVKVRDMNIAALNVPKLTPVPGTFTLEPSSDPIYPRIDNENSYLGLIKMCKERGVGDNPFGDPRFAEACGMCITSGTLKTGETFTTPTGVLVYKEDKEEAINEMTKNGYQFPHVVPSVSAASCEGASRTSGSEPVLAISQQDYKAFKARAKCRLTKTFGDDCGLCISNKESTWIDPEGGIQDITLWLYGVGSVIVTLGGKALTASDSVLSNKATKVSLGRAKEGTSINITVSKGEGTSDPVLYGIMSSITPKNKVYKLPIERFLETDRVSRSFIRKGKPKVIEVEKEKVLASKILPQSGKTSMSLEGFIPLTFVESDQLATYDCPAAPLVSSQASAELLITDPCLNPRGQGPGNYSGECLRKAILSAGCSTNGSWYMDPESKQAAPSQNIGDYTKELKELNDTIGKTDPDVSMGCPGINIGTPCDAYKNGGMPNEACIKYLYSNQSENSKRVGRAYSSADTKYTSRIEKQFQFCQPTGSLNPVKPNGLTALQSVASSYDGLSGIEAIRKYLSDIFMRSISELDINTPDAQGGRKDSWEKCIGLPLTDIPSGSVSLNSKNDVLTGQNREYDYTMGGDWIYENKKRLPVEETIELSGGIKVHANTLNNFTRLIVTDKNNKHITARYYEGPISELEYRVTGGNDFSKLLSLPDATGHYILYNNEGKAFDSVAGPNYTCQYLVDHQGDDIQCTWGKDSYVGNEMRAQCDADPKCKSYNTIREAGGKHAGCIKTKAKVTNNNNVVSELCVKKSANVAADYTCGVVDHDGDDIKCIWGFTSYVGDDIKDLCDADPKCESYNTMINDGKHGGCIKNKSNPTNTNPAVKEFCIKNSVAAAQKAGANAAAVKANADATAAAIVGNINKGMGQMKGALGRFGL